MSDTQTVALEREVRIEARPEIVFQFLVDADRMVRWMGTAAMLDARPGGALSILVAGQHRALGQYVEVDPPRRVVFTWGWESQDSPVPPGSSRIEIDLVPAGGATILRLKHSGLPEVTRTDHAHGWDHYLERLVSVATGTDPGPDPWASPAPEAGVSVS